MKPHSVPTPLVVGRNVHTFENNEPGREIIPECTHYLAFFQTTESSTDTAHAHIISRTPELFADTTNETDF